MTLPAARRTVLRIGEALLVCGTGVAGYRACDLDSRGDPESAMPAIILTLVLAMGLVACVVVDYIVSSARPSQQPPSDSAGQVQFGEAAAMVSATAGALAWLPIIPIGGPMMLASVATLSGLFALRATSASGGYNRQRRMAILGGAAGVLYILVWLTRL